MVDLTTEMAGLWTALGPAPSHRGRIILFTSGHRGNGVSTVAREFARLATVRASRPVWLIDADLGVQKQVDILAASPDRFGRAGDIVSGSPDGSCFYAVVPPVWNTKGQPVRPAQLLSAQAFMGRRLFVTRFMAEALVIGQKAVILGQGDYWAALANYADMIILDVPGGTNPDDVLALIPFADDVVLVVAEGEDVEASLAIKLAIEMAGGKVAGMVLNRSTYGRKQKSS